MGYDEFKKDAMEQYLTLPGEANELYKRYYTEIALPSEEELDFARAIDLREEVRALASSIEEKTGLKFDLVFSNSFVRNGSGAIEIKRMDAINEALQKKLYKNSDNKLAAFLNANSRDAILVKVGRGMREKLNMLFINDSHLLFQCLFEMEEGSSLDLFQFYASNGRKGSTTAPLQQFGVGKGAQLEFTLLSDGNEHSTMILLSKGDIEEKGRVRANFIYNGSGLTKTINFFDANGAESGIEGTEVIYGTKEQKFDINTYMMNSKERTQTRLSMCAVLDGSSQCQLKGYAKIEKWTKGAFSNINERGVLLSEKAHIDALPDMSIDYSDQVSATHSAATSPIDPEALFYMNSRGIDEASSRKMFVASFLSKYLSNIRNPHAKEIASSVMLGRIDGNDFGELKAVSPKGVWLTTNTTG